MLVWILEVTAKIGFQNLGVVGNFIRCSKGDILAMVDDNDTVTKRHDHGHNMFHDDDRSPRVPHLSETITHAPHFRGCEAGKDLVEQEEFRFCS